MFVKVTKAGVIIIAPPRPIIEPIVPPITDTTNTKTSKKRIFSTKNVSNVINIKANYSKQLGQDF